MKVLSKKDICITKSQKGMCPVSYWRARDRNSECTGVVHFIKVWRQKDICMGKSQKDMCPFSYWSARETNSERDLNLAKFLAKSGT